MKKIISMLCWLVPVIVHAQSTEGIKFSTAKNWQEVLTQAKKENKPIFVDAYATWCGPCKMMDRDVYTNKAVADLVNQNFISVKVQMDSTKLDNDYVKGWYADAANWKLYADAFPSFLFYTADGEYSGRDRGYYNTEDFITVLKKALDPKGSYLAQIKAFNNGTLNKNQLLKLAYWAKDNKDDSIALKVASAYKLKYVDNASLDSLLTTEADRFHSTFISLFSFKDKIIKYIYDHPEITDVKFGRWLGYSRNLTDYVIGRIYIYNVILPNNVPIVNLPDWKRMENNIAKSFDKKTAGRLILNAKIGWAYRQKDWDQAVKFEFEKIDTYGMDTTGMGRININNLVYDVIFKHVEDTAVLKRAVSLMKSVLDLDTNSHSRFDTYASILYKAGNKKQAIIVETKALNMATNENDKANVKFYTDVIDKMKNDEPIWKKD
jgi:thioredoxin-related protein